MIHSGIDDEKIDQYKDRGGPWRCPDNVWISLNRPCHALFYTSREVMHTAEKSTHLDRSKCSWCWFVVCVCVGGSAVSRLCRRFLGFMKAQSMCWGRAHKCPSGALAIFIASESAGLSSAMGDIGLPFVWASQERSCQACFCERSPGNLLFLK